jgi:hypothetical protein
VQEDDTSDTVFTRGGPEVSWQAIFEQYPGKFRNDVSQLFLIQENGNRVVGRLMKNPADPDDSTVLYVNWDQDTFPTNTLITSSHFPTGRTTVDAVIDPTRYNPRPKLSNGTLGWPDIGIRYLILEDINNYDLTTEGADESWRMDAWENIDGSSTRALANDIIEWTGTKWEVVLDSSSEDVQAQPVYVTNLRTGIQYKLTDNVWSKSFEGEYPKGMWRLVF